MPPHLESVLPASARRVAPTRVGAANAIAEAPTMLIRETSPRTPARPVRHPPGHRQLAFAEFPRDTGEPSGYLVRTISVLVRLLRTGAVDYDWYRRYFELSERQFMRDLQHLRKIGGEIGIRIGKRSRGRVALEGFDGKNRLADGPRAHDEALRAIGRVLGGPAARELGTEPEADDRVDRFLLFALPRLEDGTQAAETFTTLKSAFEETARLRFRYRGPYDDESTRTVEPYRVLARSGRYFLIGYDIAPRKGWRYFALDRIVGKPVRAGTYRPRQIPPAYLACDAIGMLQHGIASEVTVRLSPAVAASTISRRWQRAQRVVRRPDGSAEITFTVGDVSEVIRWSLGFGPEARVLAPERAVAAAQRMVEELTVRYHVAPISDQRAG